MTMLRLLVVLLFALLCMIFLLAEVVQARSRPRMPEGSGVGAVVVHPNAVHT